MATSVETMWVADEAQLQATVATLIAQGGQVRSQSPGEAVVFLKKKLNVAVLVGGLLACLLPGLAYLIWYVTADQSQQLTVRVGTPPTIRTEHRLWADDADVQPPTPPPAHEPTVLGADRPEPLAYPSSPEQFPVVDEPPPPPEPPRA